MMLWHFEGCQYNVRECSSVQERHVLYVYSVSDKLQTRGTNADLG